MRRNAFVIALLAIVAAVLVIFAAHYLHVHVRNFQSIAERRRVLQASALRGFLARAGGERILPPNAVAIAVRGDLLQSVLEASMPFRQEFEHGKYIARLDSAHVDLTDGLAIVVLQGEGSLARDSTISARLQVEGSLDIARLDLANGQLVPHLVITDVRVIKAGSAQWRGIANPAARFFSGQKAREWNDLQAPFHLPLRIESRLKLPPVDGDISVPETDLPLVIRLAAVTALRNMLVVSLELMPDSAGIAEAVGPANAPATAGHDTLNTLDEPPLGDAAFAQLHERVRTAAERDTIWHAIQNSDRDVVVVMPKPVLVDLAGRAARRLRSGATVDFRPEIAESLDKDITVSLLGKKMGAGHVHVDIRVNHLRGRLITPTAPVLRFNPPDALSIDLPIRITEGAGVAAFHARWNPAALVSVVCHGFETRLNLAGAILPLTHPLHGTLRFRLEAGQIVGHPTIRRDRIPIAFDLDARSWDKVRDAFKEQDRIDRCSVGIDPDGLVERLKALGAKGVKVRLPADLIPSFALPVMFEDAYDQGGVRVAVAAYEPEIVVRDDYLRLAVDANLRVSRSPEPQKAPGQ